MKERFTIILIYVCIRVSIVDFRIKILEIVIKLCETFLPSNILSIRGIYACIYPDRHILRILYNNTIIEHRELTKILNNCTKMMR